MTGAPVPPGTPQPPAHAAADVTLPADTADVIGRGPELERAGAFLERIPGGATSLLVLGDAGIGKTSVWRDAVGRATAQGFRVLRCAPAESEQSLTLGGLTDLLRDVADADLESLPGVQRDAIEVALLRRAAVGAPPDQRTLSVATAGLLRALSGDRPLLLALDDAQWLDDTSAAIVAYAVRRLADAPVGVLLATRAAPSRQAGELVAGVPEARRERIRLGPLPLAALHQLFQERLGRSFPRLVLVRIEEASAGNPFYALEIARELAAAGTAGLVAGERLPIPDSLGSLLEARIEALPRETRDALLLAAIATEPTTDTLRRVDREASRAIQPAVAAGVVRHDGPTIRFGHPLLAQAVIQTSSPAELRRAHAALARTAVSDDVRARHLAGATDGRNERVAAALEAAASAARRRGATLDAATLYQRAADLTPDPASEPALRRAMLGAETLFIDVSDSVQADGLLERAITAAPAGPGRAEALSLRALTRYYHGDLPAAVAIADQSVDEAGRGASADDRARRALAMGRAAFVVMQVDLDRGGQLVRDALALIQSVPEADPDVLGNLLLLDASATFGRVEALPRDQIERGRGLLSEHGRSWEHDGIGGIDFGLARATDDLDRAIAMTHDFIAQKAGPGGDDPFNLVMLSELLLRRGDVAAARAAAAAADEGYGREGAEVNPAWRLRGRALVAANDGRHDEARQLAGEGLAAAVDAGDLVQQLYHHHILGFIALAAEDHREADRAMTAAARVEAEAGKPHPGRFKLDGDRVEAAIGVGDLPRAEGLVTRLEEVNGLAPTPWTRAIAARGRGQLAAAHGDLEAAVAAYGDALVAHDDLAMPFERARTLLELGRAHRRRKEKRLADERLHEALAAFEALGAAAWAERTRSELGRVGLRPRAPTDLTETERHVAELAATGLSSRAIGERAFLAPKTVGNVLGRVYDKLGIHSRAELGARLGARPAPTVDRHPRPDPDGEARQGPGD
ncbi:MAG TPA: AAA family ATPase [Candidatus Limnocylindrales bacterium]